MENFSNTQSWGCKLCAILSGVTRCRDAHSDSLTMNHPSVQRLHAVSSTRRATPIIQIHCPGIAVLVLSTPSGAWECAMHRSRGAGTLRKRKRNREALPVSAKFSAE